MGLEQEKVVCCSVKVIWRTASLSHGALVCTPATFALGDKTRTMCRVEVIFVLSEIRDHTM